MEDASGESFITYIT